jgi:hypothetical protein
MTQTQQRSLISIVFIALIALLAWFELLLGLNGSWVCLVLAGVLVVVGVTGVWLSTEVWTVLLLG